MLEVQWQGNTAIYIGILAQYSKPLVIFSVVKSRGYSSRQPHVKLPQLRPFGTRQHWIVIPSYSPTLKLAPSNGSSLVRSNLNILFKLLDVYIKPLNSHICKIVWMPTR